MHPIEQQLKTEMSMYKMDMAKQMSSLNNAIDSRIATCVKSEVSRSEKFYQSNFMQALEKQIDIKGELDSAQLSKLYKEIRQEIDNIKNQSHNFLLSQQLERQHEIFQELSTRFSVMEKQMNQILSSSYVESEIPDQELKELYNKSNCSPDEMATFLKLDRTRFYQILNGKEVQPNLKRRHEIKQYFLKKIYKAQVVNAD